MYLDNIVLNVKVPYVLFHEECHTNCTDTYIKHEPMSTRVMTCSFLSNFVGVGLRLTIFGGNVSSDSAKCTLFCFHTDRNLLFNQTLQKHAYSKILKISQPKKENFQIKNADIFHISAQNINCGYSLEPPRRGGSNEYPQSMFLSRIRTIMYTPVNPSFTI